MLKKLKARSELIKRSLLVVLAVALMSMSIILFVLSLETYDDGYGTDISFDMDMIILFLCGCALLVYGICSIYALKRNLSLLLPYYGSFGVITVLITFYPLGTFFKAMAKQKSFFEYQEYLYIGIFGFILLIYLIFSYISELKELT